MAFARDWGVGVAAVSGVDMGEKLQSVRGGENP
jgi:hypothetical protein